MADNFSVSKESIQLPYRRFLADSAAGFVLLLAAVAVYYLPVISRTPLRANMPNPMMPDEVVVFTLAIGFLLATPLGYAINAVGWLLVDQSICYVERICYRRLSKDRAVFPVWDIAKARLFKAVTRFFGTDDATFDRVGWFFRDILEAYYADRFETHTHIKGLVVFLRSLVVYALVGALWSLYNATNAEQGILIVVAAACLVIALVVRWDAPPYRLPPYRAPPAASGVLLPDDGNNVTGQDSTEPRPGTRFLYVWQVAAVLAALLFVGVVTYLFVTAVDPVLARRAMAFLVIPVLTIPIIGAIEFYYHGGILFYAYMICKEMRCHGAPNETDALDRAAAIAEQLVRKKAWKRAARVAG